MTAPKQIGKYTVLRELGRGGMGVVYEGENQEVRHRVAIKLLDAKYADDPQIAARFRTEGIAANLPRHPGIVQVLERGLCEDGAPYIVMEYVEGEALRRRVRLHPRGLPTTMVVRLGKQIADALAAAHEAKVIHRDIKPENVILTRDSAVRGGERAKVLDFGIAVIGDAQLDVSQSDTQVKTNPFGGLIGTVYYMAPEQWSATGRGDFDDKADTYQLGIVLYELLTGQPPFVAEAAVTIGHMHISMEPPPLLSLKPNLPAELPALVHRMLSKSPGQRPTMRQVATTLERLEEELAFAGASQSAGLIPLVLPRPRRWLALALGAAVMLAGLLTIRELLPGTRDVTWEVSSVPAGAELLGPAGQVLGQTPWRKRQHRDVCRVPLTLKLAGYRPETIQVDCSQDSEQTIKLERAP